VSLELPARPRLATTPEDGLLEGPRVLRPVPDRAYRLFTLRPLGRVIGAEIDGVDLGASPNPRLRAELNQALLDWKVLFFRDQHLTPERQRAFARQWGELETNPFIPPGDSAEVVRFSRDATMPGFENIWHTDVTWRPEPALGSVLRLIEVPPVGGDTIWADMAAAYDNLPPEVRERIDGRTAVHDFVPGFARFTDPELLAAHQDRFPPIEHPVVRIHPETGRRTLFVNQAFTTHIVGLGKSESDRLLRYLFQQAHVPEYQVRFRWTPGAVAFWDNRATQHYAVNDYHPHARVAERVAIAGDRPYGPNLDP
jgi:taurine dioxygenase